MESRGDFTRMHFKTHVRESMQGHSGMPGNEYADGMIEIYLADSSSGPFNFRPGPIFGNLILADEINRARAKAQSALREATEEGANCL